MALCTMPHCIGYIHIKSAFLAFFFLPLICMLCSIYKIFFSNNWWNLSLLSWNQFGFSTFIREFYEYGVTLIVFICLFLLSYYRWCCDLPCSGNINISLDKVNLCCVFGVKDYLRREECSSWGFMIWQWILAWIAQW
jgi:hypothetical protein